MSNPIEAAFIEYIEEVNPYTKIEYDTAKQAFAAGVSHAAKANTELIKEYQETIKEQS